MPSADQVTDSVYRLGTRWVGWYLLVENDGISVVDCGFEGYYEQLPAALRELDRPLRDVVAVVLTHHHPDHVGSAARIGREAGAAVFAPGGDAEGIRTGKVPVPRGIVPNLWRPEVLRYMAHSLRNGGTRVTPVSQLQTYAGNETLDIPGNLRAIHTPGHSPGHCVLLSEERGVLFAGDAIGTMGLGGRRGPRVPPFNEDHSEARESLSLIEKLAAETIVVGHGKPFFGSPAEAVRLARRTDHLRRTTRRAR